MKRLFWVALGATAGVLVVRKITKTADNFTPDGAAERVSNGLAGIGDTIREFADDVKAAMATRDAELRDALGINDAQAGGPDLDAVADIFRTHARGSN